MLKLHHSPMACSLASRLALAEAGLEHEIAFVKTWKGEHKSDAIWPSIGAARCRRWTRPRAC